ncbi:MAG: hypothetical protein QNI87_02285 [Erythrobacter sp.]|uniref:hypothetical protein n=1 Tax=Erythrobacter sp. TaxID=1042 RepID=UPI002631B7CE|nr:hypothetical protein [Erythrobacter sp.]MDJ0977342.1 hypothetical protein [Erythrobacter sp.]
MIEIEVQNETHQSQARIRFAAVPRIGEGIRLREPDGMWASYDVLDVWYQKAEFGDVWMPYLHVRITPGEIKGNPSGEQEGADHAIDDAGLLYEEADDFASLHGETEPFNI